MSAHEEPVIIKQEIEEFIKFLKSKGYSEGSIINSKRRLLSVDTFMVSNGINKYNHDVQILYLQTHTNTGKSNQRQVQTCLNHFEYFLRKEEYPIQKCKDVYKFPEKILPAVNKYLCYCLSKGNKPGTIKSKKGLLRDFLKDVGKDSLEEFSYKNIVSACTKTSNKEQWAVAKEFLRFCCKESFLSSDYSTIIPKYRRPQILPTVYSNVEIRALENSIDTATINGKRNYALILLASRLGIRSGDIVALKFENLDFVHKRISFAQEKTNAPINLPMLPEIEKALNEYLQVRPQSKDNHIFLRNMAPYSAITTSAIRFALRCCFDKAGINISGKKHGFHSLRSSLATSMINDSAPYEAVRKILGHNDDDAIKHYARLDIEKLRKCALPVIEATGLFAEFLEGKL